MLSQSSSTWQLSTTLHTAKAYEIVIFLGDNLPFVIIVTLHFPHCNLNCNHFLKNMFWWVGTHTYTTKKTHSPLSICLIKWLYNWDFLRGFLDPPQRGVGIQTMELPLPQPFHPVPWVSSDGTQQTTCNYQLQLLLDCHKDPRSQS